MAKPADKIVSLAELRFKPANSNDAARAVLAHHFVNVPRCSFAKDDGISQYLGSETGMDTFPSSPDSRTPDDIDIPAIQGEAPETSGRLRGKLLRGGFALSIFLHAATAIAITYVTLTLPNEAPLEEGITSVTFVVEGTADADARAAGAEEVVKEPVETPVKPIEKPVEVQRPVEATTQDILKDVPLPVLGADVPEILAAKTENEVKAEIAVKPLPVEKKAEPVDPPVMPTVAEKPVEQKPVEKKPEEKPKPVEKKPEARKEEPKPPEKREKPDKKEKPKEKQKQNRGNQGDQASNAKKGDVDSNKKGQASTNSRGDSSDRQIGNANRTNYLGLVNRKLARAKGRIQAPAKGTLKVEFVIMANGSISALKVRQSSGKAALDVAALKIVRSAAPFPAIPADAGRKSWKVTVPMTFR